MSQARTIILFSLFTTLFLNYSFFTNVLKVYEFTGLNIVYVISVSLVLFAFTVLFFSLIFPNVVLKMFMILILIISSFAAYFMDTYHIVIDKEMIENIVQTNMNESLDLLSFKMFLYFIFLGVIPSLILLKFKTPKESFKKVFLHRVQLVFFSLLCIAVLLISFNQFYASFFREHKPLRYSVNPFHWVYSIGKYASANFKSAPVNITEIGNDAKIAEPNDEKKELVILVVGETARADRFSLNGYKKRTNPLLEKEKVVSFTSVTSCGTSTAVSVPCMFSLYNRDDFNTKKGARTQNILDVLKKTDVKILWRDNNSNSKGVALRVDYEDFKSPKKNPVCDVECRDIGMLYGLESYIQKNNNKDMLIVLHQMGNHGPAYYKRYPKEFEKFQPTCNTNQLEQCKQEEVSNTYDNALVYTDYFLSKVIGFLKQYSKDYETAMLYMSDHGESLGEKGFYLHGMPYIIAPQEQVNVPAILWLGDGEMQKEYDMQKIQKLKDNSFSHDNLFHTLLGIFEVTTTEYDSKMDALHSARLE